MRDFLWRDGDRKIRFGRGALILAGFYLGARVLSGLAGVFSLRGVADAAIDISDGLTGDLVINGHVIPEDQLERTPELGIVTFRRRDFLGILKHKFGLNDR